MTDKIFTETTDSTQLSFLCNADLIKALASGNDRETFGSEFFGLKVFKNIMYRIRFLGKNSLQ